MSTDLYTILIINPGSTSTKFALYVADADSDTAREYRSEDIPGITSATADIADQLPDRFDSLLAFVDTIENIDCIASRGGMVRPIKAGTYRINADMVDDLLTCKFGTHGSNLGAPLAMKAAELYDCPAIIADPVGVDEFPETARVSGLDGITRNSFSHALNLRAAARKAADALGRPLKDTRLVGVHLGGGISVAAMDGGSIIDVNDSSEGGPFTPQRTGSLPVLQLVDLCFTGEFLSADEVKRHLTRRGGMMSYLGTDSVRDVLGRIKNGDEKSEDIIKAMVYQIGKEIGAMAAVLAQSSGAAPDAVFVTGGFAREPVVAWLRRYTEWIAPLYVYPGEGEMQALADAAARFLSGREIARDY